MPCSLRKIWDKIICKEYYHAVLTFQNSIQTVSSCKTVVEVVNTPAARCQQLHFVSSKHLSTSNKVILFLQTPSTQMYYTSLLSGYGNSEILHLKTCNLWYLHKKLTQIAHFWPPEWPIQSPPPHM